MSSRSLVPFFVADLSSFAKALRRQLGDSLAAEHALPGHVQLLNMLARAAGYRNVQALRAADPSPVPVEPTAGRMPARRPAGSPARPASGGFELTAHAAKAATHFDAQGRLVRWPRKFSVQRLAMWVLWMRFDARRRYTEREVNQVLRQAHTFGDHVTLRRELIDMQLMSRRSDGSQYWKEPQRPDDEVRALLRLIRARAADQS